MAPVLGLEAELMGQALGWVLAVSLLPPAKIQSGADNLCQVRKHLECSGKCRWPRIRSLLQHRSVASPPHP